MPKIAKLAFLPNKFAKHISELIRPISLLATARQGNVFRSVCESFCIWKGGRVVSTGDLHPDPGGSAYRGVPQSGGSASKGGLPNPW